jgi:hypothetical protein
MRGTKIFVDLPHDHLLAATEEVAVKHMQQGAR